MLTLNSNNLQQKYRAAVSVVMAVSLSISAGAMAAGKHSGGHPHGANYGKPGKAANASKTVTIMMIDNRYEPEEIDVKKGETIRFVLKNLGEFVHEFNIGTAKMHKGHQEEMMLMVERGLLEANKINHARMKMGMGGNGHMKHDDPNSVLLDPGATGEIIWEFGTDANIEFACNVPGHYQAGMRGTFRWQ